MKDVNKVILLGRLGADPVQRFTQTGKSVVNFSVATTRKLMREDEAAFLEQPAEETQWHKVVGWGKLGENCAQYLKKGSSVYVEGSLRTRQYEDKNGVPKLSFEIYADEVSFINTPKPEPESGTDLQ